MPFSFIFFSFFLFWLLLLCHVDLVLSDVLLRSRFVAANSNVAFFSFLQLGSFHSRAIIFIRTLCFFLGAFFSSLFVICRRFCCLILFFVLSATFRLNSSLDISLLFFFSPLDVCTLLFPSLFRIFVKPCSTRS